MPRSLAEYDTDRGRYLRPEQSWLCGRACEGTPCSIGPDEKGRCQVHLECVPMERQGRWHCTRPKAAGGKCTDGPLPDGSCPHCPTPCQPKRGLLARRRMLTVFVAAAALGGLMLLAGGESSRKFLSPGELSVHHHALQQKCTKCHTAEEGHAVLKTLGAENAIAQSFKCLDCHQFGKNALNPHGLSHERLTAATKRIADSNFVANPPVWMTVAKWGPGIPEDVKGRLACAVCHQEHRGAKHDLKQIAEKRCQICHTKTFHAFSTDHPEFAAYPYKRRTRIHFDHSSHYGRHFAVFKRLMPHGRRPESCTTCHEPDTAGWKMQVRGFEQSCASCHGREIQVEAALPGTPLLRLPALDKEILNWKDVSIGRWPRTVATGSLLENAGPIDQLPPFMVLLLNADPGFRQALQTLNGMNLSRLKDASPAQQLATRKYTGAIRRLFRELIEKGERGLQLRLENEHALGTSLNREMRAAVASPRSTGAMLIDAVRSVRHWFPAEKPNQPGKKVSSGKPKILPDRNSRRFGNWQVRAHDFTIRYRPRQHADPFLRYWLDAGAARSRKTAKTQFRQSTASLQETSLVKMFRQFSDPAMPGSCIKCHTVDRNPKGTLQVNWKAFRSKPYEHHVTRFSHHPHLKELGTGIKACGTCHVRDGNVRLVHPQFTTRNWSPKFDHQSVLTSGFQAMNRQSCAKCHTPKLAGESCLKCHNYHIGHFPPGKK